MTADLRREEIALTDGEVGVLRLWLRSRGHDHPNADASYECESGIDYCWPETMRRLLATLDAVRSQDTATARIAALDVTILRDALHVLEPHRSVSAQSIADNAVKADKIAAEYARLATPDKEQPV